MGSSYANGFKVSLKALTIPKLGPTLPWANFWRYKFRYRVVGKRKFDRENLFLYVIWLRSALLNIYVVVCWG